jgi:hypothetical protein
VNPRDRGVTGRLHLPGDRCDGVDDVRHVMETFASFGHPVGLDARTSQRLDQLVLRAAAVEREPQRPLGRFPTVFATLALRAEHPSTPRPRGEPRVELANGALEITYDEADLKRSESLERPNDVRVTRSPARQDASAGETIVRITQFFLPLGRS